MIRRGEIHITVKIYKNEIIDIEQATEDGIARVPEGSPYKVPFPGTEYVVMFPTQNLNIQLEKR